MPMRHFANAVGISNAYLSQIERGLRAPSDAVLEAIADSLDVSTDELYDRAGFVRPPKAGEQPEPDLAAAIDSATELTTAQRRAMAEIYRGFVAANHVRRSPQHQAE